MRYRNHSAPRQNNMLRQPAAPAYPIVSTEIAPLSDRGIRTTESDEPVLVAAIDEAGLARPACPIIYYRLNNNSISDLHVVYLLAHLFNNPAKLVA